MISLKLLILPFIRRPHCSELRTALIKTSDYQISGLNIQSSILFTFGFSDRIYRSKTTFVDYSTKKTVSRYLKIFGDFFSCYPDNTPIKQFYELILDNSTVFSIDHGVSISEVVKGIRTWDKMLDLQLIAKRVSPFIHLRYVDSGSDFNEVTDEEVAEVKKVTCKLYALMKKSSSFDSSPVKFAKRMALNSSFYSIVGESDMLLKIADVIYGFDEDNVGQFKAFITKYLKSQSHDAIRKHSLTCLNEYSWNKQQEILKKILEQNIGSSFTPATLFKYIELNDPATASSIKRLYDIDITKDTFKDFEELCLYLYEPNMMSKIRNSLNVSVRARSKGDVRLGTELSIDKKSLDHSRRKYKKIVGKNYSPLKETLKVKKAKLNYDTKTLMYSKAREAKKLANKALKLAIISRDLSIIERCLKTFDRACLIVKKLSSDVAYAKKSLMNSLKQKDLKADAVEKLKVIADRELKILQKVENERDTLECTNFDVFNLRKEIERRKREEDEIPYCTWYFNIEDCPRNVLDYICNELETSLNSPKDNYVNVTSFDDSTEYTTFYIDYPKSSKIYKAFNKNERLPKILMDALKKNVKESLDEVILYVGRVAYNISMESTLV